MRGRRFCDPPGIIENVKEEETRLKQMASRKVPNTFTDAGRSVVLQKRTVLKEIYFM